MYCVKLQDNIKALGKVEPARRWYLRPRRHNCQFPVIANSTSKTATGRQECGRMRGVVGPEVSFDHRRAQMKVLAGLK